MDGTGTVRVRWRVNKVQSGISDSRPVASQPARWGGGGGLNLNWWNTRRTPPLDIVRVTSSTFQGWNKIAKGWNKIAKGWNKIAKGWNKILGMGNWGGGGRPTPPTPPPWLRAWIFTRVRFGIPDRTKQGYVPAVPRET